MAPERQCDGFQHCRDGADEAPALCDPCGGIPRWGRCEDSITIWCGPGDRVSQMDCATQGEVCAVDVQVATGEIGAYCYTEDEAFRCALGGEFILEALVCDGHPHCANGADEDASQCGPDPSCLPGDWQPGCPL